MNEKTTTVTKLLRKNLSEWWRDQRASTDSKQSERYANRQESLANILFNQHEEPKQ